MTRSRRTQAPGDWHHVMNRGARRLPIFGDDADHHAFLDRVQASTLRSGIEVHSYALMENHYHLLVRAPLDALSVAMRLLASDYTRRFNVKYGLDGALFRGRYRSTPVESERHLAALVRYIHRNPSPRRRPTMLSFRWTSHLAYSGLAPLPVWLSTSVLLGMFQDDVGAFRSFVEGDECDECDERGPATDLAVPEQPRLIKPLDVERALGVESQPERDLLRTGGRGIRNELRLASVILCFEYAELSTTAVAKRYGFSSASAVRTARQRGRSLMQSDASFASIVNTARARIRPSDAGS